MGREDRVEAAAKVHTERLDDVAVVFIDNPPMAALTARVRAELLAAIDAIAADHSVGGVVIAGGSGNFATGAGFGDGPGEGPELAALCDRLEALDKPVAAAIAGAALGGGLELALAAHLRVVRPEARLGSPEITLGLVPSAGGTQRLPKVVGGTAALRMLLSGRAVDGRVAVKIGLADSLADDDPVPVAAGLVRKLAAAGGELRRSSVRRDRMGEGTAFLEAVAHHRRLAEAGPLEAPLRLIECVEAALLLPYAVGRGLEQAAFDDLAGSDHSLALRHVFADERRLQAATRWEGRVASRPLRAVGIVSAAGLGSDLVMACLDAGFEVTLAEESEEALESAVTRINEFFDKAVMAGHLSEDKVEEKLERLNAICGYRTLAETDFVIDPAPIARRERIAALDAAMRAGAVLATGVERVDIATLAASTSRAADVVGLRLPADLQQNRAVEIALTDATGPRAVATVRAFARKLGRLIVETGPRPYGISARVLEALHAAADLSLEDGARVAQIDAALEDWGVPQGSFGRRDEAGLDRRRPVRDYEGQRGGGLDMVLAAAGRTGRSVGRGYYLYRRPVGPGVEDPEIAAMADANRAARGIRPRALSDAEIRIRCLSAMAGAGAQLLADGTAHRPADIDMLAIHALGFARRTGGVMFAADRLGLEIVRDTLAAMSAETQRIAPAASLINDLIRAGKTFSDLN